MKSKLNSCIIDGSSGKHLDEKPNMIAQAAQDIDENLGIEDHAFCCGMSEFSNSYMNFADYEKEDPKEIGKLIVDKLIDNNNGDLATTVVVKHPRNSRAQSQDEKVYERALVAVGFVEMARWTNPASGSRLALYGKVLQK